MPAMANPWGPSAGNKLDAEAEEKSTPRCVRKGVCAHVYRSKILRARSRVRLSLDSLVQPLVSQKQLVLDVYTIATKASHVMSCCVLDSA